MQHLEDKIRKNLKAFNDNEPQSGHFEKFQKRLSEEADKKESFFERYNIVIKIAAAVLVFLAISTLIYTDTFSYLKRTFTNEIVAAELPDEIVEVMAYYNVIADKKINQIDDLAVSDEEARRVKEMAIQELQILEDDRSELENEYILNPNNERIVAALLMNQQKRAEILDRIINTLNQIN
jgi:hypothetical protein